jgi:hypothetical protein
MKTGLVKTLNTLFTPGSLIELTNQMNKEEQGRIYPLSPTSYGFGIHKTEEKIAERKAFAYLLEFGRILVYNDLLKEGAYFLSHINL